MDLNALSVADAAQAIRDGRATSVELVQACLDRIAGREHTVDAWTHIDADRALAEARTADDRRARGDAVGPLNGVPVGLKDIVDAAGLRAERGSAFYEGRVPDRDATLVAALRQAGAVILGKTVTTELATYYPGKTRNPHDTRRTPGGSSSGSAAAVADFMVPGAVGTQTNGSMIRPASFCGVYGYKPTHGLISRTGVLTQSRFLDTVGVFARAVEDLALLAEPMMAFDDQDPDMTEGSALALVARVLDTPPTPPRFLFVRTPVWEKAESGTRTAMTAFCARLRRDHGVAVEDFVLPTGFQAAHRAHRTVMIADIAHAYAREYTDGKDKLSAMLVDMIEQGLKVTPGEYEDARALAESLHSIESVFDGCDAFLTPATPGEAPLGLQSTGDPTFCTIWSLLGMPAVSLPLLRGEHGLPLGVQMVARRRGDAELLRTARWLAETAGEA